MKKMLVLGMMIVMVMTAFAGCGQQGQVTGGGDQQVQSQEQAQQQDQNQDVKNQQGSVVEDGVVMDPSEADLISEDEAKKIAIDKVESASADDIRVFDLDYDDGRWVYEGEIQLGEWEYEFEINAESGEMISWEKEHIYD